MPQDHLALQKDITAFDVNDLAKTVELSHDLMGFVDHEGYFQFLNPAWEEVMQCPVSTLLSRPFIDFVHPEDQAATRAEYSRLIDGAECIDFVNRYRAADGSYKTIQWRATSAADQRIYFSAREITEQLKIQRERDGILDGLKEHSIYAVTDRTGRIIEVNEEFCRVSGYSELELLGQTHAIVNSGHHPKSFFKAMWQTIASGEVWRGEIMNRTKQGAPYWVETTIIPVVDDRGRIERYVAIRHDITERKLISERVDAGARLFSEASEVSGVGSWELDLVNEVLTWDAQTKRIHEVPADYQPELQTAIEFYAPEARDVISGAVQMAISEGEPWDIELPFRTAKGREIWVRAVGRAIYQDGEAVKLVGAFQEITVRKEHEAMLETMRDMAMQASSAKSAFLATMSHEIRTPLHAIMGMSQLLGRTELDDKQRGYLDTIQLSGNNLVTLISDILDLSRIEAGVMAIRPDHVDLPLFLRNLERKYAADAADRGLELSLEISEAAPVEIFVDPARLGQILSNFIVNAIKFTEAGYVRISVAEAGEEVEFAIEDSGIGIQEQDLGRVFERFTQLDNQIDRIFGGCGLGLSIAREMAGLLGGSVSLTSRIGDGTRAVLRLPADAAVPTLATDDRAPARPAEPVLVDPRLGAGKSALVVDDVAVNRLVCVALLEEFGFTATGLSSGQEALDYLDCDQPDLIFMDLHMPGMSGDECIARIRKMPNIPSALPIVVVSADASDTAARLARNAGADKVCHKPFTAEELLSACTELL